MSRTRHRYFAGMLGCGLLLGLLALQATPAAGASFNIYVVNSGNPPGGTLLQGNVVVFNSDTQPAGSMFPVGRDPQAISISPDGSRVYVVDFGDNDVALPLTVLTTFISVGRGPVGIAITPDGAYAYVTNSESSSVRSVPGRIVGKRLAMPTRVCRKLGLASQRESATLMGAYVAGRV